MDTVYKRDRLRVFGLDIVLWPPQRIATCVNLCLCLAIAWTGWRFYDNTWPNRQRIGPILENRSTRDGPRQTPVDMDRIASAYLFGEPPAEPDDEPKVQFVPETSLDLVLAGVVSFGAGSGSQAIVKAGDQNPQAYSIGDSLPGNATIHQIGASYIVIRRSGAFETVWLARDKPTDRAAQMIAVDSQPRIAGFESAEQTIDSGPITLTAQEHKAVREARHAVFDEHVSVSRFARLQAIHKDGELTGYRVYPGKQGALFEALQLERGDLIVAVNDIVLSHDVPADKLTDALSASDTLELHIERNGRKRALAYDLSP